MKALMEALSALRAVLTFQLAVICATLALAAHGGASSPRLDILAHFAPFWLAGGLLALLLAATARQGLLRWAGLVLAVTACIAAGGLMAPEYLRHMSPRAPRDAPDQIKLIQFNLWARNADHAATADWIIDQDPDVVVMEEFTADMGRALLKRAPGYHLTCGACSTAILSRRPAREIRIDRRSLPGTYAPVAIARLSAPDGRPYTVVGVHYTWPTYGGVQQAQGVRLAATLDRVRDKQLILAGDFNSTPWSFSRRREDDLFGLERRTRALFSWPATKVAGGRLPTPFPFLPIDQVYAGDGWRTVSVERGPRLGSDHFPVIVRLAPAD